MSLRLAQPPSTNPGDFYEQSASAAKQIGQRAILIGVSDSTLTVTDVNGILRVPYSAYADIFSFASIIVHQGGSGTTAEAMQAGRPMLIVPYGWDQPDNGTRIQKLGPGPCLPRTRYHAGTAIKALHSLLTDASFATRSAAIAARMQKEDALDIAATAVDRILGGNSFL